MTGFVDTQILFTFVKSGALRHLESESLSIEELSDKIGIDVKKTRFMSCWVCIGLGSKVKGFS